MGKVVVMLTDSEDGHVYEGDYDAAITPGNALIVSENVPDVTGKGTTTYVPKIRSIYNPTKWEQVGVT